MNKKKMIFSLSAAAAGAAAAGAAGFFAYKRRQKNGILLISKDSTEVSLFCGKEEVPITKLVQKGNFVHMFYTELSGEGTYWFKASREGCYSLQKDIGYTGSGFVTVKINLPEKGGNGYEPSSPCSLTDAAVKNLLGSNPKWKKKYPEVYSTPTLSSRSKAAHEFTSHEEMTDFIDKLSGNFRRYIIGRSASSDAFEIPMLIFTKSDISADTTFESAAKTVNKNGLPTVMYIAQIHGNEPAGGDGALAVSKALCEEFGKNILEKINVIVIPRVNPDGAKIFSRYDAVNRFDMNRDHIKVQSAEVAVIHRIFDLFLPIALIDGHEYFDNFHKSRGALNDVLLGVGGGFNTSAELTACGTDVTNAVIGALNSEGLRAIYYPAAENAGTVRHEYMVNTANFSSGRGYFSLKGCISVLVESFGMNYGKQAFERRMVSQFITVTSLLENIALSAERISVAAANARENIIRSGSTFNRERMFALSSGSTFSKSEKILCPEIDYLCGKITDNSNYADCYYYDLAERSRPMATAFVISKLSPGAEKVTDLARKHGIAFYELPEGTAAPLRQYGGEPENDPKTGHWKLPEATLSSEKTTVFESGAFVFPCNQLSGLLIMYLFEPDVSDTESFGSSFCQSGLLKPEEIFRSEHDLADGKIKTE